MALLIDRGRIQQREDLPGQLGPQAEIGPEAARDKAGQAVEIEAAVAAAEPFDAAVPVGLGKGREVAAQVLAVELPGVGVEAAAEEGEEIVETEIANAGDLQFQQGILARIGVDGMDLCRPLQGVIESIATGAGNDQQPVIGSEA